MTTNMALEDDIKESGIAAGTLKNLGMNPIAAEVLGTGAYFVPVVGSALAVGDTMDAFRRGDIKNGLINSLFIIPGTSTLKAGIKALRTAGKAARWTPKVAEKTISAVEGKLANPKFSKVLNKTARRTGIAGIGISFGNGVYEGLTEE